MKQYVWLGILILMGGMMAACGNLKNEVSPNLITKNARKWIVNSYISPQDTLITAIVGQTTPVLSNEIPTSASALTGTLPTVTLTDADRVVVLVYDPAQLVFRADPKTFPIREGRTYTLTVKTADGQTLTATTTVPKAISIQKVTLDSIQTTNGNNLTKEYTARMIWQDPPKQADFYRVAGQFVFTTLGLNTSNKTQTGASNLSFRRNANTGDFVNDEQIDGDTLTSLPGYLGISFSSSKNAPNPQTDLNKLTLNNSFALARLDMFLLHTDANYYRYHEAVLRQRGLGNNPFAEPVLIPSNITGGLGCFGAFNRTVGQLKIK
jgi:Domain of unknown function (DUF4249)